MDLIKTCTSMLRKKLSLIRPVMRRDKRLLVRYGLSSIGALILGSALSLTNPRYADFALSFFHAISGYNSFPLVQISETGYGFFGRLGFALLSNIVYEGLLYLTIPGIIRASLALLVVKYLLTGMAVVSIVMGAPLVLFLLLPVLALEVVAFSMAAVAGRNIGVAWMKPTSIYGEGFSRRRALLKAAREVVRYYVVIVIVLILSSLLETVFSYFLPVRLSW